MKLVFDTHGNEKQKECARAWVDDKITDIVYGGAKGGAKSFTGCKLIFHDALVYPETHYFIARKKLNDLRKYTIPSVHECFQDWKLDIAKYARYHGTDNYFQLYNDSRVYLVEAKYYPTDPLYARFGSMQMTRGWIEEAGEVEEQAKNNLAATIGRWKNDVYGLSPKLLQTCNPSKNYLYRQYYKKHKDGSLESWKKFIQALPSDNKRLPASYIENLHRTLSSNEKQRLLFGNWEYDDDPDALIDFESITDIFTNSHLQPGNMYITADIARYGRDATIIILWSGYIAVKVIKIAKGPITEVATAITKLAKEYNVPKSHIIVDEDGVGGGVVDIIGCKGFIARSRPFPNPKNTQTDRKGNPIPENYDSLKSQCYFWLAHKVNAAGIWMKGLPDDLKDDLIAELEQVKKKSSDDGKMAIISKDEMKEHLGRSPDTSDAMMMRGYFDIVPVVRTRARVH
jgi:hypothetical protein